MPIFIDVIKNYKNKFNYHFAITEETESLVRKYLKNINNVKYYLFYMFWVYNIAELFQYNFYDIANLIY